MERLTYRDKDGMAMMKERGGWKSGGIERLAAYEDTGLEPEEIKVHEAAKYNAGYYHGDEDRCRWIEKKLGPIDHLRDLLQAEQDGRLVMLPCKVGDTVYRVLTTRDCPPVISEVKIKTVGQAADLIGRMGKRKLLSYYLTREEAEAALKGGESDA